jgi:hypothetical protein
MAKIENKEYDKIIELLKKELEKAKQEIILLKIELKKSEELSETYRSAYKKFRKKK